MTVSRMPVVIIDHISCQKLPHALGEQLVACSEQQMNVMLAADGYPWTVIPLEKRDDYMAALERGSVEQDIAPSAIFLGRKINFRVATSFHKLYLDKEENSLLNY